MTLLVALALASPAALPASAAASAASPRYRRAAAVPELRSALHPPAHSVSNHLLINDVNILLTCC